MSRHSGHILFGVLIDNFELLVRSKVLQELCTLEGVYTLYVSCVQAAFELGDVFHPFAFHPSLQELIELVDDFGRLLVNGTAYFHG